MNLDTKRTCNRCGSILEQHTKKKKYFFCQKCNCWYECWLPMSKKQLEKTLDKIKERDSLDS